MSDQKRQPQHPDQGGHHRAARTTIVGGQPPGNSRPLPPIPVGLEQLLNLAASHPPFAEALSADRRAAMTAAEVQLTPTEEAVFAAIDQATWDQMVARVDAQLPTPERRAFFGQAAAAVAIVLGGSVAGAAGCGPKTQKQSSPKQKPHEPRPLGETGARPDRPMRPKTTRGIQPDRPDRPRPEEPAPPTGIQPDRPRPKPGSPHDTRGTGARPDRPIRQRPDPRRKRPKTGSQPDRPLKPLAGARRHDDD